MVRHQRGYLLIDLTIAMAVLSSGILFTVVFFRNEAREVRYSHERFVAQLAAEGEIERLRALPYDEIAVTPTEGQSTRPSLPAARNLKEVRQTMIVREIEPGLKQAWARVTWSSPKGKPQFSEMTGLFSKVGQP